MTQNTTRLTHPRTIWELIKTTFAEWNQDQAPRLGAALAYYAVFSLAPLLVIALSIAGLIFGVEAATGQLIGQLQGLVGQEAAAAIQAMIENTRQPAVSTLAAIIGIVTLLFGASGVFGELQASMNAIWDIEPPPDRGWRALVKDRFFSFTLVLGTGFLLLVSLVVSAGLAAIGEFFTGLAPAWETVIQIINMVVSLLIITALFALIFKYVPNAKIAWGDVWIGALVTALLFTLGKTLIGLYIGQSSFASTYGAAASLIVILLWVYYSAQILFFGAEFTQVFANTYGSRIRSTSTGQLTQPSVGPAANESPPAGPDQVLPRTPAIRENVLPPSPSVFPVSHLQQEVRRLQTERNLAGALGVLMGALISGLWLFMRSGRQRVDHP
ncbi:MAG: YihY/virulence factor BrkB family protein [Anaerolineales bacterium]